MKGEDMKKGKRLLLLLVATLALTMAFGVTSFATTNNTYSDPVFTPGTTSPAESSISGPTSWTYGDKSAKNWNASYDHDRYETNNQLEFAVIPDTWPTDWESYPKQYSYGKLTGWKTGIPTDAGRYAVRMAFTVKGSDQNFDLSGGNSDYATFYEDGKKYSYVATDEGKYYEYYDFDRTSVYYDQEYFDHYNYTLKYYMFSKHYAYSKFEIFPKEIGVEWEGTAPYSYEYDGSAHCPVVKATGLLEGESCGLTTKIEKTKEGEDPTTVTSAINAGTYRATVTGTENPNYVIPIGATNLQKSFEITKKTVAVTWSNTELVYNGQAQKPTASFDYGTLGDVSTDPASAVNASGDNPYTASVTATLTDPDNYDLDESSCSTTFTISPAPATLAWGTMNGETFVPFDDTHPAYFVYNGKGQKPVAKVMFSADQTVEPSPVDNVTVDVRVEGGTAPKAAGDYTANAFEIRSDEGTPLNFTLEGVTKLELEYKILAKPVTVVWGVDDDGKFVPTGHGPIHFTYLGKKQAPVAIVENETSDVVDIADGKILQNDVVAVNSEVTAEGAPEDIIFFEDGGVDAYDDYRAVAEDLESQVVGLDESSDNYALISDANIDDYKNLIDDSTLKLFKRSAQKRFTIEKLQLDIEWAPQGGFVYNGAAQAPEPKLIPTLAGADLSDCKVQLTLRDKDDKRIDEAIDAGDYTISARLGGSSKNFTLRDVEERTTSFSIAKKALTVVANNEGISYGDDPKAVNYSVKYDGLVKRDMNDDGTPKEGVVKGDVQYNYNYAKNEKPGTYRIMPSNLTANDNYELTFAPGTLTVSDKVTQVVAKAVSKGRKSLKFTWNEVNGATRYDVYLGQCNVKGKKFKVKKIATVKGSPLTFTKKKLKANTAYKFYVVARDANGGVISKSAVGHVFTNKYKGKYTNAKSMTVNASDVTVIKNGTYTLKASYTKAKKGKKLASKGHAKLTRFVSENPAVATVNGSGVITGVGTGWCRVYAQGVDGIWKTVTVNVQ